MYAVASGIIGKVVGNKPGSNYARKQAKRNAWWSVGLAKVPASALKLNLLPPAIDVPSLSKRSLSPSGNGPPLTGLMRFCRRPED
eukprot:361616-Chlamydomonas_euryale.AAC.2